MDYMATYMVDSNSTLEHHVFYRKIRDAMGSRYDIWNSKTKSWSPSELACDAFWGLDAYADPIEESEVLRIIGQYS